MEQRDFQFLTDEADDVLNFEDTLSDLIGRFEDAETEIRDVYRRAEEQLELTDEYLGRLGRIREILRGY